ncbi:MAG: AAA family ATPase [Clostridium sp.]
MATKGLFMENKLKLPVGIESFEEIRRNQYYYVDKTKLIEQLFDNLGKVSLFTRPRRFGKTLNMSMLKCFLKLEQIQRFLMDSMFLKIMHFVSSTWAISRHLSLPQKCGRLNFESAKYQMMELISKEAKRHAVLGKSEILDEDARKTYEALTMFSNGRYQMTEETLLGSLQTLSELLFSHYHKKTVILIDEYDVPLDKAFQHGYYKEMVFLIRAMFGKALKTNDALAFAVLTGCLRVSKESIFTGLNNFKILSITDTRFDEQFGFTDAEVQKLLSDYHLENRFREVKEWYDGYRFGKADVYCPWDIINFVDSSQG